MIDPQDVNLFGEATKQDIKVGYISTTRGYVTGIGVNDANIYAQKDPGTTFIFTTRDEIKFLNINEVNQLTPDALIIDEKGENCGGGVKWEAPTEPPEVVFSGGGGVGVVGNPIIGQDGAVLAVDLVSGGFGYKYAPITKMRDSSGKGAGASLVSVIGEIAETQIVYDKEDDFEEYIIETPDPSETPDDTWYGPDGKPIGRWNPQMYTGDEGVPFDIVTNNYIDALHKIATSGRGGVAESKTIADATSIMEGQNFVPSKSSGGELVSAAESKAREAAILAIRTAEITGASVAAGQEAAIAAAISAGVTGEQAASIAKRAAESLKKSTYLNRWGTTGGASGVNQGAGVFWWAAKPPGPNLITSNGKTTRKLYKVEHVAWNETPPPKDSEGKILDWSTNGWLNTHAISPIPPSHAKGSDHAGEVFSIEWDVDFPWDGEYSFKGCADNTATVYFNNEELTKYELGAGGAAGKILSLPTIVKKEVTEGTHKVRIDLRNTPILETKTVQASSKTHGSILQLEDIPGTTTGGGGKEVFYDDLQCYAKVGRFFDINKNKAKYKVDPSLDQPEGSELEVEYKVTSNTAFINKIEVKDLFTEQGPELVDGEPTLPETSQIEASAKFISRGSGRNTKYYMTVTGNDLLDIQLEFRKHRADSIRGGGHSVNAITIQTEDAPLELLSGPVSPSSTWPFAESMITVKSGKFKNDKEYEITFSEARFQLPTPSNWKEIQFYGLNPSNNPISVRDNGKRLCLKDGSGGDCNSEFIIESGDVTFAPDGRSLEGNRGMVTITLSWSDNPNIAGKAVNQIQIRDTRWFQNNCVPTTGVTPAGYANTTRGYVKFNDGFRVTESYVTSYVSTWLNQTIRPGYTYKQVFDQIMSSYATILSRMPEAGGFDYWVNSFKDNTIQDLASLNNAITVDANNPTDGELLLHTEHNGVEGNYDQCDENFFAPDYGTKGSTGSQTRTFYFTDETAPPPQLWNNDQGLAFYDEDVSDGASTTSPDLDGDVRAHFNILNIKQLSESVPSIPGKLELKQLNKTFKKTVIVGKVYPVTVSNAGQGLMGNTPAPIGALRAKDIVNQDAKTKESTQITHKQRDIFNTTDYIKAANRKLWRTNVNKKGGFMNDYGVCPFDTLNTLPDNPYAGTHTIRWNNVNFPISGNYTIRIGVDDNVDLTIGDEGGQSQAVRISKKGYIISEKTGIKSTGIGEYNRYIEAGKYTIQADLTQIPGGQFGFGKIKGKGAIHDYSGWGLNPMALAITIESPRGVTYTEEVLRSWHANPMGVALNIRAPLPPAPVQKKPVVEGRCPRNPVWSTRFPGAKNGTWYPVRFDSWKPFHNKYGMSPVPPLPTGSSDHGGIWFTNSWDVDVEYDGWYKLKGLMDDIGRISIDGDVKMELLNKNYVEYEETKFYLSKGKKEIKVELQNNSSKKVKLIDQKVFSTSDWVNIAPSTGGGIQKVDFRVSSSSAFVNAIKVKGLFEDQGPKLIGENVTKTDLVPGPTTPAVVNFIERDGKYYLKASGNDRVKAKLDFRCVAPIVKGGSFVQPTCVPTTGVTPAGYANTIKGYLLYNDGFKVEDNYVMSYIPTWLDQKIRGQYTYKMVFEQITESYATILRRKPEAEGFDYWVNSFKTNTWTLFALNVAIKASAEGNVKLDPLGFVTQGELGFNDTHDGLEGNYDECNENFFDFDYGQKKIKTISEAPAIQSVVIQTDNAPLRFDVGQTKALPAWPYKGSSVVKDAVFKNGKEYQITFSGALFQAKSTSKIKYVGLKTPNDLKFINSKKLSFDDNSDNGFDVNATFTIESGNATFSNDGTRLLGTGGNVTMTYSWSDNPNIAGVVLDEIKIGNTTWKQSGTVGSVTRTFNFIPDPNPTSPPEITSSGAKDNTDADKANQRLCFYDLDTSAGATAGPDLIGDVRAHFTVLNVIQMDEPETVETQSEELVKKLEQINNEFKKDVVVGQVYEVEMVNAGQGLMGNTPAPIGALKVNGGVVKLEDLPNVPAGEQGGVTHDDLVCSASHGRFYDVQGNKCKYVIDPPTTGTAQRYGITYNGPALSTYGSYNGFGPLITPTWTSDEEYIKTHNGTTWVMTFKGVDFPATDDYYIKAIADDTVTLKIDGEEIISSGVGRGVQEKKWRISKGKIDLEVVLFNKDLGKSYYGGNPVVAGIMITRKVDAFAGTSVSSKSWMENPISISAELIPPPCPRTVEGGGVVTRVIVDDPGNSYDPPPGTGYPVILELDTIDVDDPGINYDCTKDPVVIDPPNGAEALLECDNYGRIKKVNVTNPGIGFTHYPQVYIDSPTGVAAALKPQFKVHRDPIPGTPGAPDVDPDKLIQVTDLVGLKQTGYYDGRPYYGAVFYKDGVRYAGYYETAGRLVQIYDTLQESIDGMVTTPPSAIQRQGTDIASDDPNLDIPNTPDTLI